jgi:hypothetical protein
VTTDVCSETEGSRARHCTRQCRSYEPIPHLAAPREPYRVCSSISYPVVRPRSVEILLQFKMGVTLS